MLKDIFYMIVRSVISLLFRLFYDLRVRGRENVPKRGAVIIAPNHLSYLDPMLLSVACPRILNFMAKHELFKNPLFGMLIKTLNAFPVTRGKADLGAVKHALKLLRSKQVLMIFPEGTRSVTGRVQDQAESGVGLMAARSGAVVVPVFLQGTREAMPAEGGVKVFKKLRVVFGAPMRFADDGLDPRAKQDHQLFANRVLGRLKELEEKFT